MKMIQSHLFSVALFLGGLSLSPMAVASDSGDKNIDLENNTSAENSMSLIEPAEIYADLSILAGEKSFQLQLKNQPAGLQGYNVPRLEDLSEPYVTHYLESLELTEDQEMTIKNWKDPNLKENLAKELLRLIEKSKTQINDPSAHSNFAHFLVYGPNVFKYHLSEIKTLQSGVENGLKLAGQPASKTVDALSVLPDMTAASMIAYGLSQSEYNQVMVGNLYFAYRVGFRFKLIQLFNKLFRGSSKTLRNFYAKIDQQIKNPQSKDQNKSYFLVREFEISEDVGKMMANGYQPFLKTVFDDYKAGYFSPNSLGNEKRGVGRVKIKISRLFTYIEEEPYLYMWVETDRPLVFNSGDQEMAQVDGLRVDAQAKKYLNKLEKTPRRLNYWDKALDQAQNKNSDVLFAREKRSIGILTAQVMKKIVPIWGKLLSSKAQMELDPQIYAHNVEKFIKEKMEKISDLKFDLENTPIHFHTDLPEEQLTHLSELIDAILQVKTVLAQAYPMGLNSLEYFDKINRNLEKSAQFLSLYLGNFGSRYWTEFSVFYLGMSSDHLGNKPNTALLRGFWLSYIDHVRESIQMGNVAAEDNSGVYREYQNERLILDELFLLHKNDDAFVCYYEFVKALLLYRKELQTMILDRPSFYGDEFSKTPLMEVFKEVSRIYTNWEKRLPAAQFYPIYNAMALLENYHGKNKTRFQVKPVLAYGKRHGYGHAESVQAMRPLKTIDMSWEKRISEYSIPMFMSYLRNSKLFIDDVQNSPEELAIEKVRIVLKIISLHRKNVANSLMRASQKSHPRFLEPLKDISHSLDQLGLFYRSDAWKTASTCRMGFL